MNFYGYVGHVKFRKHPTRALFDSDLGFFEVNDDNSGVLFRVVSSV